MKQELDCPFDFTSRCTMGRCDCKPKQETLEEAAKKYATNHGMMAYMSTEKEKSFKKGAKWQQERSYSEEEVKKSAFDFYYDMSKKMKVPENLISENLTNVDEWFEQLKNK
jgi:hypothetical protein